VVHIISLFLEGGHSRQAGHLSFCDAHEDKNSSRRRQLLQFRRPPSAPNLIIISAAAAAAAGVAAGAENDDVGDDGESCSVTVRC